MVYGSIGQTYPLVLSNVHGFGKKIVIRALNELESKLVNDPYMSPGSLSELLIGLEPKMKNLNFKPPTVSELEAAYNRSKEIIERSRKVGIQIITFGDPDYPKKFLDIEDPPAVLYVKGDADCLNDNFCIAVVGTRHPSEYGEDVAYKLGSLLAEKGVTVVGGLAEGCDTAAHKGCLRSNGRTIAVLAHGLDRVYPAQNKKLAEDIIRKNGCLLSEYPPGVSANRGNFIQRDRLQSALSAGIIVVETDVAGGTMHTVYYCLKQGRLLGCMRHPSRFAGQVQSKGNELILKAYSAPHLFKQLKGHLDVDPKTFDLLYDKRGLIFPVDPENPTTLDDFIIKAKANVTGSGASNSVKKSFSDVGLGFFGDEEGKPPSLVVKDYCQSKNVGELNKQILIKKFSKFTVPQLKQSLKDHGIEAKGKKKDLVFALVNGLPGDELVSLVSNSSMLNDFFRNL